MTDDLSKTQYVRLSRNEQGRLRGLPITTKALAAYVRILVDPIHGLLYRRGADVANALRNHCAGEVTRADQRMLARCAPQLVEHGYLIRCRVVDAAMEPFETRDGRKLEVSPWVEDPEGDWLVIRDWMVEQHGLNSDEMQAWHKSRREQLNSRQTERSEGTA